MVELINNCIIGIYIPVKDFFIDIDTSPGIGEEQEFQGFFPRKYYFKKMNFITNFYIPISLLFTVGKTET